jgi:hypothetical protein
MGLWQEDRPKQKASKTELVNLKQQDDVATSKRCLEIRAKRCHFALQLSRQQADADRSSPLFLGWCCPCNPAGRSLCKQHNTDTVCQSTQHLLQSLVENQPRATPHQPPGPIPQALPHKKVSAKFDEAPAARIEISADHRDTTPRRQNPPNPTEFSRSHAEKLSNRQNGSRIRLELAPAHLRQGLPRLVGHAPVSLEVVAVEGGTGGGGRGRGKEKDKRETRPRKRERDKC